MSSVLKLYTILEEDLGKEKAKVIVEAIEELTREKKTELKTELKEELLNELATKKDVYDLRLEIEKVRKEIEEVRKEVEGAKAEILKWFIGLFISLVIFLIGWSWTLVKIVGQE